MKKHGNIYMFVLRPDTLHIIYVNDLMKPIIYSTTEVYPNEFKL